MMRAFGSNVMRVAARFRGSGARRLVAYAALAACIAGAAPIAFAALRADDEEPLRVAVISDLNSSYGSTTYEPEVHRAVRIITEEWKPDLVLIAGDMVAGQRSTLTDENVRAMWTAFDSTVAAPLRRAHIPLGFTVGNHDASGFPAHARDRRIAEEYWTAPEHDSGVLFIDRSRFPFLYTFRAGSVFFIAMDASTGQIASDTAQMRWLRSTLASQAAKSASLRIALGHVPLYAVAEGRNEKGQVQNEPDSLRRLFERGGVRLHVTGHHHAYYPAKRGRLELLHAGLVGQGERPLIGTTEPLGRTITLLEIYPSKDSIADHTFRIGRDEPLERVDITTLPERIDGVNGFVIRRDVADRISSH